jgi:hypothetical protein
MMDIMKQAMAEAEARGEGDLFKADREYAERHADGVKFIQEWHWENVTLPLIVEHVKPLMDEMEDGVIEVDSDRGKVIAFTSRIWAKESFLWKRGNVIFISAIMSIEPGDGSFREMVRMFSACGYTVKIPTPTGKMVDIVRKCGYRHEKDFSEEMGEEVDVWVLDPVPAGAEGE